MPKFYEVFGEKVGDHLDKSLLLDGICPMTNAICDGGGNRHQTKLRSKELDNIFPVGQEIKGNVPAICSITYENSDQHWVVCPRRLFSFPKNADKIVGHEPVIRDHEKSLIDALDFDDEAVVGIYPEVYLKFSDEESEINYHFDYVICELLENEVKLSDLWDMLGINDNNKEKIKYRKSLRENGLIEEKPKDCSLIKFFPNLKKMAVIEVMTASTSGSNTEKGTDIKSSYLKLINGDKYSCPGINKRQVWGRMATQLFAKSAITESWGAKTYWVVQDKLLENICKTTKLELKESTSSSSTINFISFEYDQAGSLVLSKSISIDSGMDFNGTGKAVDILLAKAHPDETVLLSCMLRSQLSTVVVI